MGSPTAQYWPRVVVRGPRALDVAGEAAAEHVPSHCMSIGWLARRHHHVGSIRRKRADPGEDHVLRESLRHRRCRYRPSIPRRRSCSRARPSRRRNGPGRRSRLASAHGGRIPAEIKQPVRRPAGVRGVVLQARPHRREIAVARDRETRVGSRREARAQVRRPRRGGAKKDGEPGQRHGRIRAFPGIVSLRMGRLRFTLL